MGKETNSYPPSTVYWKYTLGQALCWLGLWDPDEWANSLPTNFLSTNSLPVHSYFLSTNSLPVHKLTFCLPAPWLERELRRMKAQLQWEPTVGTRSRSLSGRGDTWRRASAQNKQRRVGESTEEVRSRLAPGEYVRIRCSREAARAPRSRGDSLVIQCPMTITGEVIVTGENDFGKGEGEM